MVNLLEMSKNFLKKILKDLFNPENKTVDVELCAFVAFACAYPGSFLVVIDTYNIVK